MDEQQKNPLGTEPIGTLLARFAIPSIIAMLVILCLLYRHPGSAEDHGK